MNQPTNVLEFANPVEVDDEGLKSMGLSFDLSIPKEDEKDEKVTKGKTVSNSNSNTNTDTDTDGEEEKGLSITTETKTNEPTETFNYTTVINTLADLYKEQGVELEAYEGFDPEEDATPETLIKLLDHNTNKRVDENLNEFFGSLSDYSQRLIQYDLASKGKDVDTFLRTLVEEHSIKSLDVENEYDQEKILRQWYKNKEGYTSNEVDEKITELKDASLLEKEAKRIKPKLDQEAENIAKSQEENAKKIRQIEKQVSDQYHNKVIETLQTGNIGGIKLNKEELSTVYSFLVNDEMEINTHKGKIKMDPLEAIVYFNKYDPKGSVERLALATLLLTNPEKFDEHYSKKAETKKTEEFVRSHKYSSSIKIGGNPTDNEPVKKAKNNQSDKVTDNNKKFPWLLKMS